jgi:hypothetical protein
MSKADYAELMAVRSLRGFSDHSTTQNIGFRKVANATSMLKFTSRQVTSHRGGILEAHHRYRRQNESRRDRHHLFSILRYRREGLGSGWRHGCVPAMQGRVSHRGRDAGFFDDGHAVAYDGCKTACGAVLVASQQMTLTEPVNGSASGAVSDAIGTSLQGFGVVAKGLASRYQDEPATSGQERFRGRFQLVDAITGAPMRNQAVRVRSTGGQYITGTTDADGYTTWVERDAREALAFDLIQKDDA